MDENAEKRDFQPCGPKTPEEMLAFGLLYLLGWAGWSLYKLWLENNPKSP